MINHKATTMSQRMGGAIVPGDRRSIRTLCLCAFVVMFILCGVACRQDMHDQPKYKPLRQIDAFGSVKDDRSARPLVEGAVAQGLLRDDVEFYTGRIGGATASAPVLQSTTPASASAPQTYQGYVSEFPMAIAAADLDRGQERFNIYCSVCHGQSGDGLGMIVRRGFRRPPSYDEDRLRQAPAGYFFDVITNGFATMPDYATQVEPADRWRIVAYIRALQLSARASVTELPPEERAKLSGDQTKPGGESQGEHRR